MKYFLNRKTGLTGLALTLVVLMALAFLAGTINNSHNAAFAQSATPGQPTAASTQPASSPAPTVTTAPAQTQTPEKTGTAETTEGNEATGKADQEKGSETDNQAALQAQAKLTVEQARSAALTKLPGVVVSAKLEDENGSVVYSVVVTPTAGGANQEIKVAATDGQILKVETAGEHNNGPDSQD